MASLAKHARQGSSATGEGALLAVCVELARFKTTQLKVPASNVQKVGTTPVLPQLGCLGVWIASLGNIAG